MSDIIGPASPKQAAFLRALSEEVDPVTKEEYGADIVLFGGAA